MELEFFQFFRQVLILLIVISLYWPLNVPFAALAYKIRNGPGPIPIETMSLWWRATIAGLGMAVLSLSLMGFDGFLTTAGIPAGLVHALMFMCFIPLGAWWMFTAFALEDSWEGLSALLIFVFLPGLFLVLLKLIFGLDPPHFIDVRGWIVSGEPEH
jgi:hypothetical protein